MTKTVVIHNVPKSDKKTVEDDLRADGYNVTSQEEEDGEYTIIGTKEVADAKAEVATRQASKKIAAAGEAAKPVKKKKANP